MDINHIFQNHPEYLDNFDTFPTPEEVFVLYAMNIAKMLNNKNTDYGFSVFQTGIEGVIIRLFDKLNRLKSIMNKNAMVNESMTDTFLDIAGYGIIGAIISNKDPAFFDVYGELKSELVNDVKDTEWFKKFKEYINE